MANNWFRFKEFLVKQDRTAMKVGTDGVLLGAWAAAENPRRILDVGTGTGLIALMMAQRYPGAVVDAVEIDTDAARQAEENFLDSAWAGRLNIFHADFKTFVSGHAAEYDLVVCNPPYFSRSLKAPSAGRNMARHDDFLSGNVLAAEAPAILAPDGILALIVPANLSAGVRLTAKNNGLHTRKVLNVRPVPGREVSRALLSFCFTGGPVDEQELFIESGGRHRYSDAYKLLTKDFYLAF